MRIDLRSVAQTSPFLTSSKSITSCLKVSILLGLFVAIGDTKYRRLSQGPAETEPFIFVTADRWDAFVQAVRRTGLGAVDPLETGLIVELHEDGCMTLTSVEDHTTLWFNTDEVEAFVLGVREGELTTAQLTDVTSAS